MTRFTKELRQKIVREFAVRHNGQYDAGLFVREVRDLGAAHPAYDWFEWDREEAFDRYQLEQARAFARDLRVTFRIEEVIAPHSVRIRETPMPMVLSPLATRQKGGGYVLVDPDGPDHIKEHCRQAAHALDDWIKRYESALVYARVSRAEADRIVGRLEDAAVRQAS